MMAEINRDVLRSIILDVLQEMGGVHEAPQFKASDGKSTTPSAAPRHEDPTGDDSRSKLVALQNLVQAQMKWLLLLALPLAVVNDKLSLVYRIKR